jgi:hypothetical protein
VRLYGLETLDLRGTYITELPPEIVQLIKLQHLLAHSPKIQLAVKAHSPKIQLAAILNTIYVHLAPYRSIILISIILTAETIILTSIIRTNITNHCSHKYKFYKPLFSQIKIIQTIVLTHT